MAFGESARALEFIRGRQLDHFLRGRMVDLGCGPEPFLPEAVGVNCDPLDLSVGSGVTVPGQLGHEILRANIDPKAERLGCVINRGSFDVVFSSHALEHCPSPISRTLAFWLEFAKVGGHLVLYLPDERFYRFDLGNPRRRNPEHLHCLTMDSFEWHVDQLPQARIVHLAPDVDVRHGRYSFLGIVERIT